MKKFLAVIFSAIIISVSAVVLSGCGCSKTEDNISATPSTDVVGTWGERSDNVEVQFNDDGTCTIGGIVGTYQIDKDNKLTVTPNSNDSSSGSSPLVFEYYTGDGNSNNNITSVPADKWAISDGKLYINGYQYTKENNNSSSSSGSSDNNSSQNNSSSSNQNASSNNNNSSSNKNQAGNNNSSGNNSSSNSSGNSSSGNSSSSNNNSSSNSNSSSSSTQGGSSSQLQNGEEDDILNIVETIDDNYDW